MMIVILPTTPRPNLILWSVSDELALARISSHITPESDRLSGTVGEMVLSIVPRRQGYSVKKSYGGDEVLFGYFCPRLP